MCLVETNLRASNTGHGWYVVKGLVVSGILPGEPVLKKKKKKLMATSVLCFKQQFHIHVLASGLKNF